MRRPNDQQIQGSLQDAEVLLDRRLTQEWIQGGSLENARLQGIIEALRYAIGKDDLVL